MPARHRPGSGSSSAPSPPARGRGGRVAPLATVAAASATATPYKHRPLEGAAIPGVPYTAAVWVRIGLFHILTALIWPLWHLWLLCMGGFTCCRTYRTLYTTRPLRDDNFYRTPRAVQAAKSSPVGRLYTRVEWQYREGYCGCASVRNVLLSVPGFDAGDLPPSTNRGYFMWRNIQAALGRHVGLHGKPIVVDTLLASEGYDAFARTLRQRLNDPAYRVVANFSRAPLSGWSASIAPCCPRRAAPLVPLVQALSQLGGHYSPLVALVDDPDHGELVAVMDLNEDYGLWFVPLRRMYDACNTYDYTAKATRGLLVAHVGVAPSSASTAGADDATDAATPLA